MKKTLFLSVLFILIFSVNSFAEIGMYANRGLLRTISAETVGEKRFCFNFHSEFTTADVYPNREDELHWAGHLGTTYGILNFLDASAHLAFYRYADSQSGKTTLGDFLFGVKGKYTFQNHYSVGLQLYTEIVGREDSEAKLYGTTYYDTEGSTDFGMILTSTYRGGRTRGHVNFGAIIAPNTDNLNRPNRFRWGGGADYDYNEKITLFAEMVGETPLEDLDGGVDFTLARLTPGVRYNTNSGINIDGAVEFGLTDETPDWNLILGLTFSYPNLAGTSDIDGDGIPDFKDGAPSQAEDMDGFEDDNGIPDYDNDNDGIFDEGDDCPNRPEDRDGFEDKDGCPDVDNDGDGITDRIDNCPNEPEDIDGFMDNDGCPDLDNDEDGIPDEIDSCPDQAEDMNGYEDDDGCPDKSQLEEKKSEAEAAGDVKLIFAKKDRLHIEPIKFGYNTAIISKDSYDTLDKLIQWLKDNPDKNLEIQGHTDNLGDLEKNIELSQKRAENIRDYLIKNGNIEPSRLIANGYGSQVPIATNETAEGRMKNRRVEFKILPEGEPSVSPYTTISYDFSPYCIHTTSYSSVEKAMLDITNLETRGFPAFWKKVYLDSKGGYWYRVIAGAYETEEDARDREALIKVITHADFAKILNLPFAVQVGAFEKEKNAIDMKNDMRSQNYPAYIISAKTQTGTLYRVLIDAFETKNDAHNLAGQLKIAGIEATVVKR